VPRGAPLGLNGVLPSAVIKGCWQLSGGHRGDAATDRTTGKPAVADFSAFVAAGIDTFDAGPEACGYGPAELLVGQYVASLGAAEQRPLLFTKLCCVGGEQSAMSADFVRSSVKRAAQRLQAPRIDVMQIYWNDLAYKKDLLSCAQLLQEERDAGRVGAVAYTNMPTSVLASLHDAGVETAAHQIQFSLLDRRPLKQQAAWCRSSGCKLLPYGVLAGGLLSDAYLGQPASAVKLDTSSKRKYGSVLAQAGSWAWFQRLLTVLRAVGDAHGGASVANVAARWVLEHDFVGSVILGARNARNVADHQRLFAFALTEGDKAAIQAVLDEGIQPKGDTYDWERGAGPF